MPELLKLDSVTAGYGEALAVFGIDLTVREGEITALLGPNGAGKTTMLLTIMGFLKPVQGDITSLGKSIIGRSPHSLARDGWAFVPDDRALLSGLTVAENIAIVRNKKIDPYELFPELKKLVNRRAGLLSGGEQQMLALARALSTRPKLLMVDELSLGLAPIVVGRLLDALKDAASSFGTGVLLVEQQVERALRIAKYGHILVHGRIQVAADAATLLRQREIVEASYLGGAPMPASEA